MKALELTVYPRRGRETYVLSPAPCLGAVAVDRISQQKRLTDAELAAEYYAQDAKCRHEQWIEAVRGDDDYTDAERAGQSRMYEQLTALHRFATMPHYDEVSL